MGLKNILYVGLAAGLATLVGCGGRDKVDARVCGRQMLYDKLTPNAREALNNAFYNRVQHGRCKCRPQELSAVLMKAAYADGIPDNEITYDEIRFINGCIKGYCQ